MPLTLKNFYRQGWKGDMDNRAIAQTSSALSADWRGGVFFNNNGNKIFLTQFGNGGRIYECNLSTPYDITTIDNFNNYISLEYPEDIHFSVDGTKMFILKDDASPYQIKRYTLSTAWDITTATNDQNLTTSGSNVNRGLYITPDGLTVYTSTSNNVLYKATLSTAWDLTTASAWGSTSGYGGVSIWFGNDGKMFFRQPQGSSDLYWYELSTGYDLSTIVSSGTKSVGSNRAGGLWFNDIGTICVMVGGGSSTNYITEYTL